MKGSKHVIVHRVSRMTHNQSINQSEINTIRYLKEQDKIMKKEDIRGYGDDLKRAVTHRPRNWRQQRINRP